VVNPSMSKSAFHLLGLEPSYTLDLHDLEQRYLRLQGAVHPDRFIHKTDMEKSMALKQSADLNQAYQTLKCPLKRAAALLLAKNVAIPGQNGQTIHNPTLLMEVMEWQDTLMEAQSAQEIGPLIKSLEERLANLTAAFDRASPADLPQMYSELSYILKLQEEIKHKRF
jgi:molecular chaperone HscB